MKNQVFILSARRTAIGGFLGSLAPLSAVHLGKEVISAVLKDAALSPKDPDEVILGNVLSANLGQAPARQAARLAGVADHADATTINKVCSSGMKAIMYGIQSILAGNAQVVIAGGMESMSNAPYYLNNHRGGHKTGHHEVTDGLLKDGLWDPYHQFHMGNAAELANRKYHISREEQDEYTLRSFMKAKEADSKGWFRNEIVPVEVSLGNQNYIYQRDEDVDKLRIDKVSKLKPIFDTGGSITAANASNINDGAAAVILASEAFVNRHQLTPLARIVSFADAAQAPEWFTTSPALSIKKALDKAGMDISTIDYLEINEAYANVPILNGRLIDAAPERINVHGGAVALGHPLGASGARIVVTLAHILQSHHGQYGVAGICNGGGGSSAMLIERC